MYKEFIIALEDPLNEYAYFVKVVMSEERINELRESLDHLDRYAIACGRVWTGFSAEVFAVHYSEDEYTFPFKYNGQDYIVSKVQMKDIFDSELYVYWDGDCYYHLVVGDDQSSSVYSGKVFNFYD